MLLNMGVRGIGVYRTLFYLPALVPPVAGTITFMILFDPTNGLINIVLEALGLPVPGWFLDPLWAKPALIIMSLWSVGTGALIFLAGLKEIPQILLEAAAIDGANAWQQLPPRHPPAAHAGDPVQPGDGRDRLVPGLHAGAGDRRHNREPVESTLMYMVHIYRNAFRYF